SMLNMVRMLEPRAVDPATRNLLLMVQVCFGVFPVLGKLALESFEPRALLVWRMAAGGLLLMGAAVWRHGRQCLLPPGDLAKLFGLSVLGVIANQLLFLEGLKRSSSVHAGLVMTTIPVATVALAVALGDERITLRRQLGMLLSTAGVAALFLHRGADLGGASAFGDLLMALNALSYSAYLVLAKRMLHRMPQLVVVAWLFIFGLACVPWFALDVAWVPAQATTGHWLALAGILLFPTLIAYLLNAIVLSRAPASTAAAYVMLQPFVAASLGITLLGERPSPWVAVTAVCVLAGLWLVSVPGRASAPAA
ncbi:MAG: DMT family transporter, partial [Planctomycetota bacterium]